MKTILIPLDERPANTRYPRMIAAIGGIDLRLPPAELLSRFRTPAPCSQLAEWLLDAAVGCDALIVSLEMLLYGGLIASRVTHEPIDNLLARLDTLRVLKQQNPLLRIFGFNLITRISRHDDATEEPVYWSEYGSKLFRFSQLVDRAEQGQRVQAELGAVHSAIPAEYVNDFLWRRQRNHAVNRAALNLLYDGVLDLLVLSSDDTSEYGLGSREKRFLAQRAAELKLGDRLLMYPGADEVGCVLFARLLNETANLSPSFQPIYLDPKGRNVIAPFEDVPISITVERQIRAAGGRVVEKDADIMLYVNPPIAPDAEWVNDDKIDSDATTRLVCLETGAAEMKAFVTQGCRVAAADVAYANGASHLLMSALKAHGLLDRLIAFGAWNTAGNTLGTVIAQACAARLPGYSPEAQGRFLAHRWIEDWGYQSIVRPQVRNWLAETTGKREPDAADIETACQFIEGRLAAIAHEITPAYRVTRVHLPWNRTFEVDFDLELA